MLANVLNLYDHGRIQDNLAKMVVFLGQRLYIDIRKETNAII